VTQRTIRSWCEADAANVSRTTISAITGDLFAAEELARLRTLSKRDAAAYLLQALALFIVATSSGVATAGKRSQSLF
jgi:hypothetical protein